ncbi:MAG: HAD-IC family P-type ATPase [Chloroflexota bacterium]
MIETTNITGLSQQEVATRRARGEGNQVEGENGRSYLDILRSNLFTFFNNILYAVGILLVALGQTSDALLSVGLGVINAIIGTIQEMRAKRKLDQVALLNQPEVVVLRAGQEQTIRPEALVMGDVVLLRAGDQALVDGRLLSPTPLEMDESLLTGETDLIRKQPDDTIMSGSYCVTGEGLYEVTTVGADTYANQVTASARVFEVSYTPLQRQVNFVIRLVMVLVAVMSLIIFAAAIIEGLTFSRLVEMAAVLTGLVPYGLFTMIVVAYALGASRMASQGALVQQTNAIESLSNIDVLCMDKTGTLTTNALEFDALFPLTNALSEAEIGRRLGLFVNSASSQNKTSEALATAFPTEPQTPLDEIPFASARKWSALSLGSGTYALGAIEMLAPYLPAEATVPSSPLQQQAAAWSDRGLRVLFFARNSEVTTLHEGEAIRLPALTPLALVSLRDALRPFAAETLSTFEQLGIDLKIISGDNPRTVAALAKQAGLKNTELVSGPEIANVSATELRDVVNTTSVFGRITPEQKQAIVDALITQGHYVAMMGDGVNDVLSLKKAQVGIAMQSGSQATRNVADMVLLQDSFGALRPAFNDGKNIVGGLMRTMYLYIARSFAYALVVIGIAMMGLNFPFEPAQISLTLFSVGIPGLFMALWARPIRLKESLLRSLVRFTLPAALLMMLFGLAYYTFFYYSIQNNLLTNTDIPPRLIAMFEEQTGLSYTSDDPEQFTTAAATIMAQTMLSIFINYAGIVLLLFLEPPHRWFEGWTTKSDMRWPGWLALGLWVVFTVAVEADAISTYFGLAPIREEMLISLWAGVLVWAFLLRSIWRSKWLDNILTV